MLTETGKKLVKADSAKLSLLDVAILVECADQPDPWTLTKRVRDRLNRPLLSYEGLFEAVENLVFLERIRVVNPPVRVVVTQASHG